MKQLFAATLAAACFSAVASEPVRLDVVDGNGVVRPAGTVKIEESAYGLVFTPALEGLPAGVHGFHVHENPTAPPAKERRGRRRCRRRPPRPAGTKRHGAPWGDGHLGDLPPLSSARTATRRRRCWPRG